MAYKYAQLDMVGWVKEATVTGKVLIEKKRVQTQALNERSGGLKQRENNLKVWKEKNRAITETRRNQIFIGVKKYTDNT